MMPFLRFTWNTKTALPLPPNERNANVYTHASAYAHHEENNDNIRDEVPTQPYEKTRNQKEKHKRGRSWRGLGWTEDNDNDGRRDVRNPSTATTPTNGTFSQLRRRFSGKEKKTRVVDVDGSHSKATPSIRKQHRRSRSESSTAILDIVAEPKQTPTTNTIPTTTQHCPTLSTSSSATACSYSDDQLLNRRSKSLDLDEQLSRQQQQQQQQKQGETDREKQLRQEQELQSLQEFANSIRAFMGEFRRASAVAEAGNEIRDEAEVAEAVVEGEDEDEVGVGVETEIETGSCALVEMRRMIIPPTVRRDDTPLTPIREEDEDEQLTDDDDEGGSDMQDISYTSFTSSTFSSLGVPLTPPLGGCDPFVVGSGVGMLACVPEVEEGDEEGCVDVSVASCGVVDRDKALPAPPVDRDEDTQRSSDTRSDVNSIMNAHESLVCELRQNNKAREDDRVAQPEVESVFGSARSRSRSSSIDSVISTMSMMSHCRVHDSTDVEDTPTTAVAVTGAEEEDEKDVDLETATEGVNASFFSAEEGLDDDEDDDEDEDGGIEERIDDDVWAPPPNIDNTFDSILDTRSDSGSEDEESDSDSDSSFGVLLDEGTFGRGVLTPNPISESIETGLPSPSASPASDGSMEREMPSSMPSPVQQRPWGPAPSSATTSPSSSLSTSSSLGEGAKSRFGEVPFPSPTTTPTRCVFMSDTNKVQDQAQASSSKVSPSPKAKKGSVSLWGVSGGMGWPSCESGKERQRRVTVHDSPVSTVPLPPSPFATRTASLSSTMEADAGLYEPEQMVRPRARVGSVGVRRRKSRTRSWWSSDDADVDAKSWTGGESDGGVEVEVGVEDEDEGRVGGGILELDSSPDDEINACNDCIAAQVEDADYMRHDIDNVELKRALTHANAEMRQLRARNDELVRTVECMREEGLRKEHDHRAEVDELNRQVDELRETVRQLRVRLRSSKLQSTYAVEDADSLRQDDETGNLTSKASSSGTNTSSVPSKDKDTMIPIARRRAISDCYIVGLGAEREIQPQPWMWTPPQTPHFIELDLLTGGDTKAEVASV